MKKNYEALVVNKIDHSFSVQIESKHIRTIEEGEVLIEVHYSSINYKDCLACSEHGHIVRTYPHTPGIDLSGIVVKSKDIRFKQGDRVIATSYTIGVSEPGGFSEFCIVKGDYIVPLPTPLSLKDAMIVGTAGLTAALAIRRLELNGLLRQQSKVLVTGATGGVGSLATAMLAALNYEVVALTRKASQQTFLTSLGASSIMSYNELRMDESKALDKQLWDGVIDVVGGQTLASIISKLRYGGSVASCGLTGGTSVHTNVFPFILRGVNLLGIDSVNIPMEERNLTWKFISEMKSKLNFDALVMQEITLREIPAIVETTLQGKNIGRYLVKLIDS